jgi:phenylalanyl-tRNA synthetase beta chain
MNMSLTKSKYAEAFDAALGVNSVSLLNPLSKDLSHMRSSLLFGGMESISLNEKHRATDFRLFEIGKEYRKTENGYKEKRKLALWLCGKESAESWKNSGNASSLTQLRAAVENILNALGIQQVDVISIQDSPIFAYGMELSSQKKSLVKLGRVSPEIQESTDVEQEVFYAEFDFDTLEKLRTQQRNAFQPLNKFPWVRRDLSLLLNKETTFESLRHSALKSEKKLLKEVNLFDVYEGKNLPEGKKSYALKFILQDAQQTLTDEVVEKSMHRILQGLQTECSAELR